MNRTTEFGCCLNTVFGEFNGRRYETIVVLTHMYIDVENYSDGVADQIEYAIITGNMYTLCGVTDPGFCEGVHLILVCNSNSKHIYFRQLHQNLLMLLKIVFELQMLSSEMIIA